MDEFHAVLERDRLPFTDEQVELLVSKFVSISRVIDPQVDVAVVEADPDDHKILETPVSGDVDCIVSGDSHLLDLEDCAGIDIASPAMFLEGDGGW